MNTDDELETNLPEYNDYYKQTFISWMNSRPKETNTGDLLSKTGLASLQ